MLSRKLQLVIIFTFLLVAVYVFLKPAARGPLESFDLPLAAIAEGADHSEVLADVKEMVLGSEQAPVTIIEYASFTCPHCASFHENDYQKLKKNYIDTGAVKFIFREVYFDKYGVWASLLARCAGPEKFFGMTDMLLSNQNTWARAGSDIAIVNELRKVARLAGMEENQVENCLSDGNKIKALVAWYRENATKDKIQSTPSFIINGELYGSINYEKFTEIIKEKLGS